MQNPTNLHGNGTVYFLIFCEWRLAAKSKAGTTPGCSPAEVGLISWRKPKILIFLGNFLNQLYEPN